MHFESFLAQNKKLKLIKLFFVVSGSIFLSFLFFWVFLNVNKDTILCRVVPVTIL